VVEPGRRELSSLPQLAHKPGLEAFNCILFVVSFGPWRFVIDTYFYTAAPLRVTRSIDRSGVLFFFICLVFFFVQKRKTVQA